MKAAHHLARIFHPRAAILINTVASARCFGAQRNAELFQQFGPRRRKPLKRLSPGSSPFHRAEATVLMRVPSAACEPSVKAPTLGQQEEEGASSVADATHISLRDLSPWAEAARLPSVHRYAMRISAFGLPAA